MAIQYIPITGDPIVLRHDPDNWELYTLVCRPDTFTQGREVIENSVLLLPSAPNGCMYLCSQGGVTGVEPSPWNTAKGSISVSGTARFKALPYNLLLKTGETIQSVTVTPPAGVTVDNAVAVGGKKIHFRVTAVPVGATSVDIQVRFTVLRTDEIEVRYDKTITLQLEPS